jgi:drug/metabolite transporter (DMT)-like permease
MVESIKIERQSGFIVDPCVVSTFRAPLFAAGPGRTLSNLLDDGSPRSKTLGIIALIVAAGLIVLNIAAMKAVSATTPGSEIVGMRGFLACSLILAFALILGRQGSLANLLGGVALLRVGFDTLNAMMFLSALTLMSFVGDASIQQTLPLIVVYACFVLGERLERRQIAAVVIGFTGALLIAKPSFESLGWGAALAFGATISIAARNRRAETMDPPILPHVAMLSAGLVLALGVAWCSLSNKWTAPSMLGGFDDTRGGFSEAVRGIGRPTVVRLQLADGL